MNKEQVFFRFDSTRNGISMTAETTDQVNVCDYCMTLSGNHYFEAVIMVFGAISEIEKTVIKTQVIHYMNRLIDERKLIVGYFKLPGE